MKTLALIPLALLVGCSTLPPRTVEVKVAVPVKCKAVVPERPVYPTEVLPFNADPFAIVRATMAEISFREAHEVKLTAALKSCL